MFIDYYALLEIDESSTQEEIKSAFRKQAIKWHPDRNPGVDTTVQMQRINEAYLILKDPEARQKFDTEYQSFKQYKEREHNTREQKKKENENEYNAKHREATNESKQKNQQNEYTTYTFNDDVLKNWMNNARKQSVELAKQTIKDFKGMVKAGFIEGAKASGNAL